VIDCVLENDVKDGTDGAADAEVDGPLAMGLRRSEEVWENGAVNLGIGLGGEGERGGRPMRSEGLEVACVGVGREVVAVENLPEGRTVLVALVWGGVK
jgi:hypothetical protein